MSDNLDVTCPCCGTRLTLDRASGEILAEERPKPDTDANFESAWKEVSQGSKRREDAFTKAMDRTRRQEDLLQKKFDEARKKASRDDAPPRNPFDAD